MTLTVLYVCTGNVCRSPTAAMMFAAWARQDSAVNVSSAGTYALVGDGMDSSSAQALAAYGIDGSAHRARQFAPWMATEADLVLTAECSHRDAVMTAAPTSFRRTFTMKEFARLVHHLDSGLPRRVIAEAAQLRANVRPAPGETDDVIDPFRRPLPEAAAMAEQVGETVRATLRALGLLAEDSRSADSRRRPLPRRRPRPHFDPTINR